MEGFRLRRRKYGRAREVRCRRDYFVKGSLREEGPRKSMRKHMKFSFSKPSVARVELAVSTVFCSEGVDSASV